MLHLPSCPHCGTVYRYRDTVKTVKKKENICSHCKKIFTAKTTYVAIEAAVLIVLCICVNLILLFRMREMSLIALFAVTLVFLLLIFILMPFYVRFTKTAAIKKKGTGHSTTVHQHQKQQAVKAQQSKNTNNQRKK